MRHECLAAGLLLAIAGFAGCEEEKKDSGPFEVVDSWPEDGQAAVSRNGNFLVRFTHPPHLGAMRLSVKLFRHTGYSMSWPYYGREEVPVTMRVDGNTLALTPYTPLMEDSVHWIAVYPGAMAENGRYIREPRAISFCTGPATTLYIPNHTGSFR
ncbi:MAG: Ig-like domain-containing domain [Planctomycetota bacterium]|jgi:hypothetical protein